MKYINLKKMTVIIILIILVNMVFSGHSYAEHVATPMEPGGSSSSVGDALSAADTFLQKRRFSIICNR